MSKKTLLIATMMALSSMNVTAATVEEKIDLLQRQIEDLKNQMADNAPNTANKSKGIEGFAERTTIGGYGNLNYNSFNGASKGDVPKAKDKIDLQRFVLYFGHKFNDMVSFKSELEIAHAISSADDAGEVEVEQAYLDFHFNDALNTKVGLFLIPAGFINESHEPPTFYGVERNEIESRIIPTTWREAGVAAYGEVLPALKYQVGITTGFSARKFDNPYEGIKSSHQEGQLADAENLAFSAALNYTGITGLLVGGSVFTGNTGQHEPGIGNARLTLWDVHSRYQVGNLDLRALYARGHLSDAADITAATGVSAPSAFYGWFTEAAYHVWKSGEMDFAPFVRYERYDTQARLPSNSVRLAGTNNRVWTVGASFWPTAQVVLKADFQKYDKEDQDADENRGDKRLNLGMGYMF